MSTTNWFFVRKVHLSLVVYCLNKRNYYDILGVKKTATVNEIREAYLNLCKKHHPDVQSDDHKLFQEINEAYTVLISVQQRQLYDHQLNSPSTSHHHPFRPFSHHHHPFSDFQSSHHNEAFYRGRQWYEQQQEAGKQREEELKNVSHSNVYLLSGVLMIIGVILYNLQLNFSARKAVQSRQRSKEIGQSHLQRLNEYEKLSETERTAILSKRIIESTIK